MIGQRLLRLIGGDYDEERRERSERYTPPPCQTPVDSVREVYPGVLGWMVLRERGEEGHAVSQLLTRSQATEEVHKLNSGRTSGPWNAHPVYATTHMPMREELIGTLGLGPNVTNGEILSAVRDLHAMVATTTHTRTIVRRVPISDDDGWTCLP
jgi:hypothetical protein